MYLENKKEITKLNIVIPFMLNFYLGPLKFVEPRKAYFQRKINFF